MHRTTHADANGNRNCQIERPENDKEEQRAGDVDESFDSALRLTNPARSYLDLQRHEFAIIGRRAIGNMRVGNGVGTEHVKPLMALVT